MRTDKLYDLGPIMSDKHINFMAFIIVYIIIEKMFTVALMKCSLIVKEIISVESFRRATVMLT